MADITASMVKELREATGAGMMECKKALVEAEGDAEKATDILRTTGLAAAAKKADRATNEGRIYTCVCENHPNKGAMTEVNCETDFVAINEKFAEYCKTFTKAVCHNNPKDVDELMASEFDGTKVQDILTDAIHVIGENMSVARFERIELEEPAALVDYIHMNGKIGVIVGFKFDNADTANNEKFKEMARDVAMHIAATNPIALDGASVPADVAAHELEMYEAQAAESGKPENIQEQIAQGRMKKFYKENCLMAQEFVKDPDVTVDQYIKNCAKEIGDNVVCATFTRFAMGQ
ncbi:MAG: translation elongation factor Ts [Coriobacteriales bacterium]|nr:translation elongation factor Ts [Coriobacteriales bacterium]